MISRPLLYKSLQILVDNQDTWVHYGCSEFGEGVDDTNRG